MQVLLVNLLIAMMNDTYASAKADGQRENHLNMAQQTSDSAAASIFFPPLNIVAFPIIRALNLFGWLGIKDEEAPNAAPEEGTYKGTLLWLSRLDKPIDLHHCELPKDFVKRIGRLDMLLQVIASDCF